MDRWKAEMGRVREKRRVEERRWEKRKSQKKEDGDARKGRKVAKHCVFRMICGSGGSKSRLAKAARWETKKCTPLWREAHFEVKMYKALPVRATVGGSDVVSCGRRKGLCTFSKSKVSKTWGFCSISKNDGRRGTVEEDLQRCMSPGRRSTKDMFIRDVRRSGRWFPEMGCILEHQICRFAKMILRDRCSASYNPQFLLAVAVLQRHWMERSRNALVRGHQRCTQLSIFEGSLAELLCFWCCQVQKLKKSRRIASFWMLSSSKIEVVSQNCFVLGVVNFEKWRSLAELLHFWRCQVQTLRKSRRLASFLMLSTLKMKKSCRIAWFSSLQIDR